MKLFCNGICHLVPVHTYGDFFSVDADEVWDEDVQTPCDSNYLGVSDPLVFGDLTALVCQESRCECVWNVAVNQLKSSEQHIERQSPVPLQPFFESLYPVRHICR